MRARELVGWNLKRLRVARNVSQEALGLLAGREQSYIGRIERGRENPTVETLEALAVVLDAPLVEFFVVPATDDLKPDSLKPGVKPQA